MPTWVNCIIHIRTICFRKHAKGKKDNQVDLDLATFQRAWPLSGPWQARPLSRGTNNEVLLVETPAGSYILRVYGNHADLGRLRFEHSVMTWLQGVRLPFAVPVPLPTARGELYVCVESASGVRLASLTAHIPGEHPHGGDLAQARAGGEALGLLDVALGSMTSLAPRDGVSWRSSGDLAHCHPLVPEPLAAFRELPVAEDARRRLVAGYEWVMEHMPGIYATLLQQVIHEDFDMSNVLMDGERVTGVLDFEFCGRNVRAMDLAVALNWWPVNTLGTGDEWPIICALAMGYARYVTLTEEETAALPLLIHFRAFTSLIHRLGRYRQGLNSIESVVQRIDAALEREDWLYTNSQQLVECVRQAFEGKASV